MSLNPNNTSADSRTLVPATENADGQPPAFTRLNRHLHLHLPLNPLGLPLPTSSTRPSSPQLAETGNSFFLRHPPPYPLPASDEIPPLTAPPTELPAMPEVVLADDLNAESQDDDTHTYSEMLAAVDRIHRTRHDPSMLGERRVLKVPRVRKHHSSSARRERKLRSRSRPSDMDPLSAREEAYSREQRLGEHIPMQGDKPQEEPGSSRHDKASDPPPNIPEIRVEHTGERRPATPPRTGVDTGRMDWCQQTPPRQTRLEESLMDWSGNSWPAPAAPTATPPPPPQPS